MGTKRKTIEDCQKLATHLGGKCLSLQYKNNTSPIIFQCVSGHQWTTNWQTVNQGSWCPKCAINKTHNAQRFSIGDCRAVAESKNGQCLSIIYTNADSLYEWQCEKGHMWKATYASIALNGSWCKRCFDHSRGISRRNTLDDAQSLAELKGGQCLSSEYNTALTKMIWQCGACSTIWKSSYNNVQRGRWCPNCQTSKTEKEVRSTIEKLTGKKFPKRRFKILDRRFELDCYNDELRLAIEYDGEQHYLAVPYWGGKDSLKKTQERDSFKDSACTSMNITLIRVPYTQKNNIYQFLLDQLNMHKVKIV